ncbi:N-acetylneuraminate lyase [Paenibacillus sp.]|uniref:N-acetylneuraminate lyase n=1 Tax=Paenibacillus sp. TaxID=58172 RepID=UPI002810FC73|nr:N-acetylneuraminate lyase [Paenibacillus sp.]
MSTQLIKFKGVIVAMNSCYDSQGNVCTESAKKLTRFLIDKGVHGLYVGGSTGEGLLQTTEERKQVLEAVLEEAKGEVTVIAHVGALSTRESVELAVHAEQSGADALSAISPFYYRYGEESVAKHWNAIVDSTSLPFIIYHIPSTTGFSLTSNLLREMAKNPKIIGVKITTASTYELQQFKRIGGDNFVLFNGPDEQYLAGRIMGAEAGIGGTYGVMPELFVSLEKEYRAGRIAEAQKLQYIINDIITDLLDLPIYAALKSLMNMRGIPCGEVREPLPKLTEAHQARLSAIYEKIMNAVRGLASEVIK